MGAGPSVCRNRAARAAANPSSSNQVCSGLGSDFMARSEQMPRDLLLGLLALQNGLVTRDQLVAAFGAWTGSPREPMGEILVAHSGLDSEERALLEALVEKHLKRHGGDPERSLAALEVGRSTRESLASALGPAIEKTLAGAAVSTRNDNDADRTTTYTFGAATSEGQRFRILRPHARGVWESSSLRSTPS